MTKTYDFFKRSFTVKTNEAITKKRERVIVNTGFSVLNFLSSHCPRNTPSRIAPRNWNAIPEYLR